MKKLFSLLLAVILILPMGAQEGGETMGNYLYNGVELPSLPSDWDKKTYPYAFIHNYYGSEVTHLVFTESQIHQELANVEKVTPNSWMHYITTENSLLWEFVDSSDTEAYVSQSMAGIRWANYDVYNIRPGGSLDGTLYLKASIPILADSKLSVSVAQMMSYNGTELPDINYLWDKKTHPYAYIDHHNDATEYGVYFSDLRAIKSNYIGWFVDLPNESSSVYYRYDNLKKMWVYWGTCNSGELASMARVKWASVDILYEGDSLYEDGALYLAASEPVSGDVLVTKNTATVNFTCKELLYTDTVYHIKAWCYPKGMDFWTAPATWESDLFAGPSHSESVTFTGLLPGTEYEVYACIYGIEGATEHNATAMFTTAASEEETLEAVVMCNQVTENSFVAWLLAVGLDSSKEYTAVFEALENDETSAGSKTVTVSGSSVSQSCAFTGLKPNTDYVVYVDLYTEDRLVFSGECEVATLDGEIPVVGYDRDSFLLGFASGLGATAATKIGAEYNSWAQGYLAGCALRKAL